MMRKHLNYSLALSLSLLAACGQKSSQTSNLDGHYEGTSSASMLAFEGKQRAIAEYAPSRGVIISLPILTEFGKEDMAKAVIDGDIDTLWVTVPYNFRGTVNSAPEFSRLRNVLGSDISKVEIVRQDVPGSLTIWARDWSPLGGLTDTGNLRLLDFNYYAERDADDYTAQSLARLLDFERVSVPVYNEGGNFMNNTRGHCMMTTRVTDANRYREQQDDIAMDASAITAQYQKKAGCSKVTIFPRIPYEGTGHIDMWAKFLNDDTLIVNEIRDEIVNLPGYDSPSRSKVINLQRYLDARADEIEAMGYNVIRLPMPAPVFSSQGDTFRSYTNSITVNGLAVTPRYLVPAFEDLATEEGTYIDEVYRLKYEREVRSVYEGLGYEFTWVPADEMIAVGGAVHCTTMQITR